MGSKHITQTRQSLHRNAVLIEFIFYVNGASDPVAYGMPTGTTLPRGVTSITRTGTGTYLVTLDDTFKAILSARCQYHEPSEGAVTTATISAGLNWGTTTKPTVEVRTITSGVVADVAAATGKCVSVALSVHDVSPGAS